MFSYKLLNASEIDMSDTHNHCFSAIQEEAARDNSYINEMTLPQGTVFFLKSTVPDNQPKPYVEIDCKPRTIMTYKNFQQDRNPDIFVSQTIVLSLYGFTPLQAVTLRSRMIRYGLLTQNFGAASNSAIEDDLLASALIAPEDALAVQNTQEVLNGPVKIISFDFCYWEEKYESADKKTICHANVTWTEQ